MAQPRLQGQDGGQEEHAAAAGHQPPEAAGVSLQGDGPMAVAVGGGMEHTFKKGWPILKQLFSCFMVPDLWQKHSESFCRPSGCKG
jgi:hypothetical protein